MNQEKSIEQLYKERQKRKQQLFEIDVFEGINFKMFSREHREYLQIIYALDYVTEEGLRLLLLPIYGEHGFKKATKKLIDEGFVYKERFGKEKFIALTRKGNQYFQPDEINVEKTVIREGSIGTHRAKETIIVAEIIKVYRQYLLQSFKNLTQEERNQFLKEQYIKYVAYKKFLLQDEEKQKELLKIWGAHEEEVALLEECKNKAISKRIEKLHYTYYPFKQDQEYINYIKWYREKLKTDECIYLLRDLKGREKETFKILEVLKRVSGNLIERGWKDVFFNQLVNDIVLNVYQAECKYIYYLSIKNTAGAVLRRSLQRLKEAVESGQDIEPFLKQKETMEKYMKRCEELLRQIEESKLLLAHTYLGKEKLLTFNHLKQSGIFLKRVTIREERHHLMWTILDNGQEAIRKQALVQKVFLINEWMGMLFKQDRGITYSIEVATYTEERNKAIKKEITQAIKRLQEFPNDFVKLEIGLVPLYQNKRQEIWDMLNL